MSSIKDFFINSWQQTRLITRWCLPRPAEDKECEEIGKLTISMYLKNTCIYIFKNYININSVSWITAPSNNAPAPKLPASNSKQNVFLFLQIYANLSNLPLKEEYPKIIPTISRLHGSLTGLPGTWDDFFLGAVLPWWYDIIWSYSQKK